MFTYFSQFKRVQAGFFFVSVIYLFFNTKTVYFFFQRDHKPFRGALRFFFLFVCFCLGNTDHTVNLSVSKQGSPLPGSGLWTWLAGDRGIAQTQDSSQSLSPGQGPIRAPRMGLSQSWRLAGFYGSFWCLSSSSRHSQR